MLYCVCVIIFAAGLFKPTGGFLRTFEPPVGEGVRVDTYAPTGQNMSTTFDSLLAKLIVHSSSPAYETCVQRMLTLLTSFRVVGFATNRDFLVKLLSMASVQKNDVQTTYVDRFVEELRQKAAEMPALSSDAATENRPEVCITAPIQGTVLSVDVSEGMFIRKGQQLAVMEAMKMEHVVTATVNGVVRSVLCRIGDAVRDEQHMFFVERAGDDEENIAHTSRELGERDLDHIRPDLQEVLDRHAICEDTARAEKVAKRHKLGRRTARENTADMVDAGSFMEYGGLTVAAQRQRRTLDDLIQNTPADGLVCGVGTVNGDLKFAKDTSTSCVVLSYEYMVLAGTQGMQNHRKKDRMFELAESLRLPVILFAEGGTCVHSIYIILDITLIRWRSTRRHRHIRDCWFGLLGFCSVLQIEWRGPSRGYSQWTVLCW